MGAEDQLRYEKDKYPNGEACKRLLDSSCVVFLKALNLKSPSI